LTKTLPFADRQDSTTPWRLIGTTPTRSRVAGTGPRPVWSMRLTPSSTERSSDSVTPAVAAGAAQRDPRLVQGDRARLSGRGFDISNMTSSRGTLHDHHRQCWWERDGTPALELY